MSFILRYDGMRFSPSDKKPDDKAKDLDQKVEKFGHRFSNIGGLVMRFQLGQRNRAALIQEIVFQNYAQNPITLPARGKDQEGVFSPDPKAAESTKKTLLLGQYAHATLGRGVVFNERLQPQLNLNTQRSGEAFLWDIIHKVVWGVGLNYSKQLAAQGFMYISSPPNDDPEKHKAITEALANKNYTVKDGAVHVLGEVLPMAAPTGLIISLDPEKKKTTQENGFIISSKNSNKPFSDRPLGWMIHEKKQELVAPDLLEDSIRVIKIGITRFHQLTPVEQKLLMGGRLTGTGETRVSQNALFNGLYAICKEFNKNYDFDPEQLLGNQLEEAAKNLSNHLKDPQRLDGFLTGVILTEMTQPLKVSMQTSERSEIPSSFSDRFYSTSNNARALAYAFDFRDSKNREIFIKDSENPISDDPDLIDVNVKGKLASPSLSSGKDAGAILSTAILVGEQMFLEQLLRDAIKNNKIEDLLKKITGKSKQVPEIANKIKEMAASFQQNENGPIMGLQYPHCEEMISYVREQLGFNQLIELANLLEQSGMMTDEAMKNYVNGPTAPYFWDDSLDHLEDALMNLYSLGEIIQENEGTSGSIVGSRGINAGLVPLILKLDPELAKKMNLSLEEGVFKVPEYTIKSETTSAPHWIDRIKSMFTRT